MRVLFVVVLASAALALAQAAPGSAGQGEDKDDDRLRPLQALRHKRQRGPPPPPEAASRALNTVQTNYLSTQLLDHFDPTVSATWRQRYFSNDELYEEGGPIFIFIEGESEASSGWIATGGSFMYTLAQQLKAKMYVLEHRFFGMSQPTEDISTANLKWLSADQALADLAYFIEYLTEKGEMTRGQKLAVFGGSYPGNLAAWARIKYPHLIHAAVASSAPVHAETNFPEYFEVVTQSIRTISGNTCADNLQKAFKRLEKLAMTDDGLSEIQTTFNMCEKLDTTNQLDMDVFYEALASPFATATQYNRDNSYSEYSLAAQCAPLTKNMTDEEAVSALAEVFSSGQYVWSCIDFSYAANTQYLTSTTNSDGGRQWIYMTCTQFGYFQTADGNTVFPKGYFGVEFFEQQCKDAFGSDYNGAMVDKGVLRSNIVFGDRTPDVTNVAFVNGVIDPWHALGVLSDVNEYSPAIVLNSTSHCYDMYPSSWSDPAELQAAHEKIKNFVKSALYSNPVADRPKTSL